jgi:hypothetical protein
MAALRSILAKFGIQVDTAALATANDAINGSIGLLQRFGGLLTGGLAAFGITRFMHQMAEFGDELTESSQKLGINAQELMSWRYAASLSGVEAQSLATSLQILQKNAFEATTGSKEMRKDFGRLGIVLKDSNGQLKSGSDLMMEVGVALGNVSNSAEKVALARSLLGRSGAELLPLFNEGAEGMERLRKEGSALFSDVTQKYLKDSAALADMFIKFEATIMGVKVAIARELMPPFLKLLDWTRKGVLWIKGIAQTTYIFEVAALGLAARLLYLGYVARGTLLKLALASLPILVTAAALAFIALVVEDLYQLFTGGRSVIGEFIDSLFGVGAASNFVHGVKDAFAGLLLTLKAVGGYIVTLYNNIVNLVKTGLQLIPLFITQVAQATISKLLELIAGFKQSAADIFKVAAKLGSYVGIDLSRPAADVQRGATTAARDSAAAKARLASTSGSINKLVAPMHLTINGADPKKAKEVAAEVMRLQREREENVRRQAHAALTKVAPSTG